MSGCGCDAVQPGLMPVADALEQLLDHAIAVTETVEVSLHDALGRVLAEDQLSLVDVPPRDNSAMDGYAINVGGLAEGQRLTVSQRIPAGTAPLPLEEGTAARIFTGSEIPEGANAVVMQENTTAGEDGDVAWVEINQLPELNGNIREQGQDVVSGQCVMPAGTRLQAAHLGVLASVGIARVRVYRPLKVAVLATGDELVMPGNELKPGQIYNSNLFTLQGLLRGMGFEIVDLGIVEDTLQGTVDALARAAEQADCIISTGGVSVGEEDHVKPAVEALGELNLWRMAIKPGKPMAYGNVKGVPFIGLPGNPAAVLVTFTILARPYLLKVQGASVLLPNIFKVKAGFTRTKKIGRQEYLRAELDNGIAVLGRSQSSGVLSSAVAAAGYLVVPPQTEVNEGDELEFVPFGEVIN